MSKFRFCNNLFSKYNPFLRYYSHTTLDRNKTIYSVLKPYLDFDEKLENLEKFKNNIKLRGIDIDLPLLITKWQHYKSVKDDIQKLEKERIRITEEVTSVEASADADKIKSLKLAGVNVREALKTLKIVLTELEDQLYPQVLQLPNEIAENFQDELIYSKDVQETDVEDHIEVGNKLDLLEYISPKVYFLKGAAAVFELAVCNKMANLFVNNNFIQFSNPDFTRHSIVECLKLKDIQSLLSLDILRDDEDLDRLHLNGGASVFPFCCYHSKSITNVSALPLQYVTKGRHYAQSQLPGLYGVWQNTSVQIFIGTTKDTLNEHLSSAVKLLTDFYATFEIPLRVVYVQPNNLSNCEEKRISFQTFSTFHKQYFELGNLSLYGDYISKRMRMYYSGNRVDKFIHVISGTVLKVPPLLASLLEYKRDCSVYNSLLNKDNPE